MEQAYIHELFGGLKSTDPKLEYALHYLKQLSSWQPEQLVEQQRLRCSPSGAADEEAELKRRLHKENGSEQLWGEFDPSEHTLMQGIKKQNYCS